METWAFAGTGQAVRSCACCLQLRDTSCLCAGTLLLPWLAVAAPCPGLHSLPPAHSYPGQCTIALLNILWLLLIIWMLLFCLRLGFCLKRGKCECSFDFSTLSSSLIQDIHVGKKDRDSPALSSSPPAHLLDALLPCPLLFGQNGWEGVGRQKPVSGEVYKHDVVTALNLLPKCQNTTFNRESTADNDRIGNFDPDSEGKIRICHLCGSYAL